MFSSVRENPSPRTKVELYAQHPKFPALPDPEGYLHLSPNIVVGVLPLA